MTSEFEAMKENIEPIESNIVQDVSIPEEVLAKTGLQSAATDTTTSTDEAAAILPTTNTSSAAAADVPSAHHDDKTSTEEDEAELTTGAMKNSENEMSRLRRKTFTKGLRKGKWAVEETMYAEQLIVFFKERLLQIPKGTMLRMYLAEKLHCEPMRITKKFSGKNSIGKQVYAGFRKGEDALSLRMEARKALKPMELTFLQQAVDSMADEEARATSHELTLGSIVLQEAKEKVEKAAIAKRVKMMGIKSAKDLKRGRSSSFIDDEHAGSLLMGFVSKVNPTISKKTRSGKKKAAAAAKIVASEKTTEDNAAEPESEKSTTETTNDAVEA